jgi:hypothetical protein
LRDREKRRISLEGTREETLPWGRLAVGRLKLALMLALPFPSVFPPRVQEPLSDLKPTLIGTLLTDCTSYAGGEGRAGH